MNGGFGFEGAALRIFAVAEALDIFRVEQIFLGALREKDIPAADEDPAVIDGGTLRDDRQVWRDLGGVVFEAHEIERFRVGPAEAFFTDGSFAARDGNAEG